MTIQQNELAELAEYFEASAETYRFFSQVLFKELNAEAIDALAAGEWPSDTGNAHLDAGYAQIARFFALASGDVRSQLAVEYARIFLAAGVFAREKRTAVPYESVFVGEEHAVMGEARDDVVVRFAEDGFQVNPDLHEPEDHLSFELEYLAHMSQRALQAARSGDASELANNAARQCEFIEQHLLNWVPTLREVAATYAQITFYLGILDVMIGTLEQSLEMLREIS